MSSGLQEKIIIEYTIFLVPVLVATVLNCAVTIVIRRSELLQSAKFIRCDLFFNIALGSLLTLLSDALPIFLPNFMSLHEVTCRGTVYVSEVSQSVTHISLVLAALSRYLNVINPYHSVARAIQRRLSLFIWIIAAVCLSPYLITHGITTGADHPRCAWLSNEWTTTFSLITALFFFVPTVIYGVVIHFVAQAVSTNGAINSEFHTLKLAARTVRTSFGAALVIFAPLQLAAILLYGFLPSLLTLVAISAVMLRFVSTLEPVCFAIFDPTFRHEYRMQITLPDRFANNETAPEVTRSQSSLQSV